MQLIHGVDVVGKGI